MSIGKFFRNIALSIDQLGNAVIGGSADETISARSYRKGELEGHRGWKVMQKFVDTLFFFDDNHTMEAYRAEMARNHMPEAYRQIANSDSSCELQETIAADINNKPEKDV